MSSPSSLPSRTACLVAGGGPAGMMLGVLLARAGVEVLVLEKHGDFLRDFRGDTIHPSTLEVIHEMGVLDEFLKRPHEKVFELRGSAGEREIVIADFSGLKAQCPFIAFMPQWEFLDFLANEGKKYPGFRLEMEARAAGLVEEKGRIVGARVETRDGLREVRADLVVAADGRHSILRGAAGLEVVETGAPIDVLWMKLSRKEGDPAQPVAKFGSGSVFVMLYRGDYWQCAWVIAKGGIEAVKRRGLEAFRAAIAAAEPFVADRVGELASWEDVKLLTVAVDHLKEWSRPGFLCIGDAAHAMSPVGGVGINLAIQDAVATANILAAPLREKRVTAEELKKVQKRREWPARMTQRMQVLMQDRIFAPIIGGGTSGRAPGILRAMARFPVLRRIPARVIGMGFRPEHVRTRRPS